MDICYADSTSHGILCSFNNGAYSLICLVSAGCGGASLSDFVSGTVSTTANSAAYVTVYSWSAPALPAGACFELQSVIGGFAGSGTFDIEIFADTSLIYHPWTSLPDSNYWPIDIKYCNQAGVQNAQYVMSVQGGSYGADCNNYVGSFSSIGAVTNQDAQFITPSNAIDWSTGHTITVKINPTGTSSTGVRGCFANGWQH